MNKNIIYVVLLVLVVLAAFLYFRNSSSTGIEMTNTDTATTTDQTSTSTGATTTTSTTNTETQANTNVKVVPGYPASWPTDVPKYTNGSVTYKIGNNTQSGPTEAIVVASTSDSVKTVLNFYMTGLVANGWKITENGAGLSNQVTFRATKGKRAFGGYIESASGKTTLTMGLNAGY